MSKREPFILTSQLHDRSFLQRVEQAGFEPVHAPLIGTNARKLSVADIEKIESCDWLVFTSQTAVHAYFSQVSKPTTQKIAVVGSKTEKAIHSYGYEASFMPSTFSADVFVKEWNAAPHANETVAFLKGNLAKPTIEEGLDSDVPAVCIYDTVTFPEHVETITDLIHRYPQVTLVFASPSAVNAYVAADGTVQTNVIYCAIGHITKRAMTGHGFPVHVMPSVYTLDALLEQRIHLEE
ncbi:hypothetical protein CQS04_00825 [Chryseomicrobium excrementi]|uniref:Uroporphyrinogen-III synthase n=2 Tax=Chryseomicrobium excrementi TaxID=2041346 RepID=A0A2M9F1W9_9BACL|nr:hypothetical protein CQS04_00825 [Chryseomicrobium excrementi]